MEFLLGVGNGHADGGTAVHRLDNAGNRGGAGETVNVLFRVVHPVPLGGIHPQAGDEPLGQVLIHGDARTEIARAGVRDAQKLKGRLNPAVLAAGAVEAQEDDVRQLAQLQHALAEHALALPLAGGRNGFQIGCGGVHLFPRLGNGLVKVSFHRTGVILQAEVHIHQGRLMAHGPQCFRDHGARGERHVSLRA